jgi:hypothetical protein
MSEEEKTEYQENRNKIIEEIDKSYRTTVKMPLDLEDYVYRRSFSVSPRVGIINETGYILCTHLGDNAKGKCTIKPHGERLIELSVDSDGIPNKALIITGGVAWEKGDNGQAKAIDVKVCTRKIFSHKSGSKAWVIKPGIKEGCIVPMPED